MADFFAGSKARAAQLTPRFAKLWDSLEETTLGGKRFRPLMVWTAYKGLDGSQMLNAAQIGTAFELLHTAFIIHDDVVDRDFVRRGRPNLSGRYLQQAQAAGLPAGEAKHRAMSVAVVAGDLALFNAYRLIDRSEVGETVRTRLLEILDDAIMASAAGELLDIEYSFPDADISASDIIGMEQLKTALYSFEAPLKAGAVLAGANDQTIAELGKIGRDMGIAYQIVDDLLGVFGHEVGTGKSTLGDLREGKRTVLMGYAATQSEWPAIAAHLGNPDLSHTQADAVRKLLTTSGSRRNAERLARSFADQGLEGLSSAHIPEALRKRLENLIAAVIARTR
ncbi:polyprenyl synthetase family protein [Arthrobacter sp. A5]|uniref:polyprenyl synthetase family protein n=1 Tax=Arthrobacter sp. A5 TaxID=576926 RepID=UPI003DAA328B